ETYLVAGNKILKIAKNDEERENGYRYKINALRDLIRKIEAKSPDQRNQKLKYQEELDTLIEELEKEGKFPRLVNDLLFLEFTLNLSVRYNYLNQKLTAEDFEQIKKEMRQWMNKEPLSYSPCRYLLELTGSKNVSESNPELAAKTVRELITFVNSSECTLSDGKKKETIKEIEGYLRRCRGSDLKLYGKTLDNKDFDWDALRGKYVLVKFTASWCGPCKGEIPGMLKAYEQYHDKGLEIVSVYVWDRLADTKRAIEEEKLPWLIISEELTEKANQNPQSKEYGIPGVPTMLLIDKDGKVLDTGVRGERLQNRLAELFDKK
ncbi:MAG: redoxin family protein, partial [Planctomycetaceae bacterium]|nr:redoxin family protein [Planctomycetaceae bacterium]